MKTNNGWHVFWLRLGAVCTYALFRNMDVLKTAVKAVDDYMKGK